MVREAEPWVDASGENWGGYQWGQIRVPGHQTTTHVRTSPLHPLQGNDRWQHLTTKIIWVVLLPLTTRVLMIQSYITAMDFTAAYIKTSPHRLVTWGYIWLVCNAGGAVQGSGGGAVFSSQGSGWKINLACLLRRLHHEAKNGRPTRVLATRAGLLLLPQ